MKTINFDPYNKKCVKVTALTPGQTFLFEAWGLGWSLYVVTEAWDGEELSTIDVKIGTKAVFRNLKAEVYPVTVSLLGQIKGISLYPVRVDGKSYSVDETTKNKIESLAKNG